MSKRFTKPFRPIGWAGSPHDFTGDNQLGIYTAETTQRYIHGTRYLMWDGRVFKYALAHGECESYHGCCATEDAALSYTAAPSAASAGDRMVQITLGSRSEDDLVGGYIMLYDGGDIDTTNVRGIIGNTASDTTVDVYMDFPLHLPIVATTDAMEIFENPYGAVTEVTSSYSAWVGVPCVSCVAVYNIWIQTWGPACISPANATLDDPAASERTVFWTDNAALAEEAHSGVTTANQYAGYILNQGTGIAGPIIQLFCST